MRPPSVVRPMRVEGADARARRSSTMATPAPCAALWRLFPPRSSPVRMTRMFSTGSLELDLHEFVSGRLMGLADAPGCATFLTILRLSPSYTLRVFKKKFITGGRGRPRRRRKSRKPTRDRRCRDEDGKRGDPAAAPSTAMATTCSQP
jgi:hypothetical protein